MQTEWGVSGVYPDRRIKSKREVQVELFEEKKLKREVWTCEEEGWSMFKNQRRVMM